MVLIITEKKDYSTGVVLNWLNRYNVKFIVITPESVIKKITIDINNDEYLLMFQDEKRKIEIKYKDIDSIWYRRGYLNFDIRKNIMQDNKINKRINAHLTKEWMTLIQYVFHSFEKKNFLGNFFIGDTNKIITLKLAKQLGLLIPKTHIVTDKDNLLNLVKKNKFITKGIQSGLLMNFKRNDTQLSYHNLTNDINENDFKKSSDSFFPSLIQEKIKKLFEIRTFYINSSFYSMAIFSQLDDQTKTDFRNYNFKKPNRCIPIILPTKISEKLIKLLNMLKLNTASIDIIYTSDKKYYFLEINPIGQYEMVSIPCNYNLGKVISEFLINKK
ncbi:MAG TPA: grasp-with-spasm system ATP-grasp peptide maturase [Bacteroidales bacterium]|nr:grasp-with-spasm system ATP-grasp peptide maturase [Bacteroidales bacterium]HPS18036.1 grasp-with-spasm system ATP-grasp peptide maturase [Bacteroidales bacterium]